MNYKSTNKSIDNKSIIPFLLLVTLFISIAAAWVTHIIVCLSSAAWGFLIAGAIIFPIAIIHGYGIWFGFF